MDSKLPKYTCTGCNKTRKVGRKVIDGEVYCSKCSKYLLKDKMAVETMKSTKITDSLKDISKDCKILGTCNILEIHHEVMKDDPERLRTDFMIKLICGEQKLSEYKSHKIKEGRVKMGKKNMTNCEVCGKKCEAKRGLYRPDMILCNEHRTFGKEEVSS